MKNTIRRILTITTLIAVILTATAFGFRPIFHPPTVSILDALRNDETNFRVLIGLIRESGLKELTKEGQSFTLLAPTNTAFAKLPAGTLESFRKDKNKLRQLLFNHLLSGKILFKGTRSAEGVSEPCVISAKPLTNLAGGSAKLQCNGVFPDNRTSIQDDGFIALVNGKARVLEADFEGNSAVIHVIDTVLIPDDRDESIGVDSGSPVRNEVANGLSTTTFDTLVGTVTVNLPDDLAAGDTISGTVIAEPKKQTVPAGQAKNEMPMEQEKAQDELSGYVVEVAKQETPMKNEGEVPTADCQGSAQQQDVHFINVCKKWSIPDGVSKIPVVLKNREGKVVGRTDVPVAAKVNRISGLKFDTPDNGGTAVIQKVAPANASDYLTPSVGQAGKPLSVKGAFDGDFANTKVKIGDQTMAKFIAASPRKVVVESPRDLTGLNGIEVIYKGISVAKCSYRSIGIRLAADKLNLIKGETTTLTVTLAGLIGLLSPVEIQLTNRSPGTVSMEGGETQTITVNPGNQQKGQTNGLGLYKYIESDNDSVIVKRTLTGVKAGGFSINAAIDPAKSIQGNCNPVNGGNGLGKPIYGPDPHGQPLPTPRPTPGDVDADGNPRRNDGPGHPVNPFRGRYRVTLNGFTVNHVTYHGVIWHPDAVTFHPHLGKVFADGTSPSAISTGDTNTIGVTPDNPVRGGTAYENGGLQTGDGFPTQTTPWLRTLTRSTAPMTIPPTLYFEGEIVQNTDAMWIAPNIWDIEGWENLDLVGEAIRSLRRDLPALRTSVARIIRSPQPLALSSFLLPGSSVGLNNTMSLAFGSPQNRPIGIQPIGGDRFGFTPQVLVLTYESAEYMSRTSFGFGRGIVPVRYVDSREFGGDYTLYFQVERMDTMLPCAAPITGSTLAGSAVLRTTHDRAPGPYNADINLTVDFADCHHETIRITNFPPVVTPAFEVVISAGNVRQNITTVTKIGGGTGTFDPVTGRISIPVTLHFQHSIEAEFGPILAGQSDLTVTLTTEGTGGRRLSDGRFVLVGSGPFLRGFLGSKTGDISVTGTFTPSP